MLSRHVTMTEHDFEMCGPDYRPEGRLLGTIYINDCPLHVEAIAVIIDADGLMSARCEEWAEMFNDYYTATGSEGHLHTIEMLGERYALFASPFCL